MPTNADNQTILYLIRHGATEANLAKPARLQGRRHNPPLARVGIRQAEATRDFLAVRPIDRCYTSPLLRAVQTATRTVSTADARSGSTDSDLMRRMRALIDETEKRQQRELALRIGEVLRDVNAQRQADLGRIDRSLGLMENNLGVEVLKQRQSLNYLMRVNQR